MRDAESPKDQGRVFPHGHYAVPPKGWFHAQVVDFPHIAHGKREMGINNEVAKARSENEEDDVTWD
jgi:hypothetical protein